MISIILNKDCFNGRSVGKNLLNIRIIDCKTKEPASIIRCIIRNLTIVFWPIEVFAILISPNRRIGDYLVNTEVIEDFKNDMFLSKKSILNVLPYIITIATCMFFLTYFVIYRSSEYQLLFKK